MPKRILTFEDLVKFCEDTNFTRFNADESGYQLCVTVPSTFEKKDESDELTLYGRVKLFHTNENRNGSSVTKEAAERCLGNIKYKPVLANFCEFEDEDGNIVRDFTSHDIIINDDGTTTYLERQVGCFTADEPIMEYDEENDRYYVIVGCAIPREYTDAAEIIERKGGTKISSELFINAFSYDAERKILKLEDIEVAGGTLLGKNPNTGEDVQEGMEGARVDIAEFSANNFVQKFDNDPKLIQLLESINNKLDAFSNINTTTGKEDTMTKFELLLEQYGKTIDDITFEHEGLSDEELEAAFSTAFADIPDSGEEEEVKTFEAKLEVSMNGNPATFTLSLNEKIDALSILVNETYGENDCDYYDVTVYEEDSYVDMFGVFSGKSYRQSFKCKKKKEYTLVGDRVETHKMFMTDDEIAALESMKTRYSELEEYHDKKEMEISHAEKMAILAEYSDISGTDEYKTLVESIDSLTNDEISEKADAITGRYARKSKNFAAETKPVKYKKVGLDTTENTNPKSYSGLFE